MLALLSRKHSYTSNYDPNAFASRPRRPRRMKVQAAQITDGAIVRRGSVYGRVDGQPQPSMFAHREGEDVPMMVYVVGPEDERGIPAWAQWWDMRDVRLVYGQWTAK